MKRNLRNWIHGSPGRWTALGVVAVVFFFAGYNYGLTVAAQQVKKTFSWDTFAPIVDAGAD